MGRGACHPHYFAGWPILVAMLVLGINWSAQGAEEEPVPAAIGASAAPPLALQVLGRGPARTWVQLLPIRQVGGQWIQPLWFKKGWKQDVTTWIAVLNLATGEVKEVGKVAGLEILPAAWSGDCLYLGTNRASESVAGQLVVYDARRGELQDLGPVSDEASQPYRLSVGPDGTVAIGTAMGAGQISLYDPRHKSIRKFGKLGQPGHGYVYSLWQDQRFIYGALRGSVPWELIAVDKQSGQRRSLLTKPIDGYIDISGSSVRVAEKHTDGATQWQVLALRDGQIQPMSGLPAPPSGPATAPMSPPVPPPKVFVDDSPTLEYQPKILLHYQCPDQPSQWRTTTMPITLSSQGISLAVRLPDGRIAGTGPSYDPLVVIDPQTEQVRQFPLGEVALRSILEMEGKIYVSGYPSTAFARIDPDLPVTCRTPLPGEHALLALSDQRSNPRLLGHLGQLAGDAHMGVGMVQSTDGRIWIVARRHRYYHGFDLVWFDPKTEEKGALDAGGAFDHLQVSWSCPLDGGAAMAISTYVLPDQRRPGQPPAQGRLFVVDLRNQRVSAQYDPAPGFKVLAGVAADAQGRLVGVALDPEGSISQLYRLERQSGQVQLRRTFRGLLHGQPGTTGLPGKGGDFQLGPDGAIWTLAPITPETSAIVRILPEDLSVHPLGQVASTECRFLFVEHDLILTGFSELRRAVGVVPRVDAP